MRDKKQRSGDIRIRQLRQALAGSIVSLILCCAMLAGTTYAWFTECISSGIQTIQSGNLDVRLRYKKSLDGAWQEISVKDSKGGSGSAGISSLFPDKVWKPGDVEYVFLEIINTGSLPLAYQLTVSEGAVQASGSELSIASPSEASLTEDMQEEYEEASGLLLWLEAGCIQGEWYEDEDYQIASPGNAEMIALADGCPISDGYQLTDELEDGREIITLVIYMPSETGSLLLQGEEGTEMTDKAEFCITFDVTQCTTSGDKEAEES